MLLLEIAGPLVAAVALLLQRMDRRADRTTDVQDALIQIYRLIDDWAALANHVNAAFEAAREAGEPVDASFDAFDGLRQQVEYSEALARQTRVDAGQRRAPEAAELLAVYAPEVLDALLQAASIRTELVHEILIDYARSAGCGRDPR